jgi:acyl carrier protein
MEFRLLDLEADPGEQGYSAGEWDVILATNVIHATRDLVGTLRRLRTLLRPEGLLLLNEATEIDDYLTMTFGLLPGWWAAEDHHRRIPHSPLATRQSWNEALTDAGFTVDALPGAIGAAGQRLFVARNTGASEHTPVRSADRAICEALAQVLEIPESRIQPDIPFLDFGLDSLTAIEMVKVLNQRLGSDLRTMDLYNYPTVERLAARLGPPPPAAESNEAKPQGTDALMEMLEVVASGQMAVDDAVQKVLEE